MFFQGNFPLQKTEIWFVLTIKNTLSSAHTAFCNIPLPLTVTLTDNTEFTGDPGPSVLNTFTPKSSAKQSLLTPALDSGQNYLLAQ